MKVFLFPIPKQNEDSPDYLITQRQRQPEGSENQYETVEVGFAWNGVQPNGEKYITCKIEGFNDSAPVKKG